MEHIFDCGYKVVCDTQNEERERLRRFLKECFQERFDGDAFEFCDICFLIFDIVWEKRGTLNVFLDEALRAAFFEIKAKEFHFGTKLVQMVSQKRADILVSREEPDPLLKMRILV